VLLRIHLAPTRESQYREYLEKRAQMKSGENKNGNMEKHVTRNKRILYYKENIKIKRKVVS
jgi:hypothetical protein